MLKSIIIKSFFCLLFIAVLFSTFPGTGFSQQTNCPRSAKQAELWYFGEKAGIDFRSGTATAVTDENVMTSLKGGGTICDSMGNLLFFTDAKSIWDRDFNKFPYAPSMEANMLVTQACIIVPRPGDSNHYYIFTVDFLLYKNFPSDTITPITNGFKYSLVDMKGNLGKGNGTNTWNVSLLPQVSQKVTAVKHQNNVDYWVITHKWNSNEFYAFLVTENGVSAPVVSQAGIVQGGGRYGVSISNDFGAMKASPDGSKIALAVAGQNTVELLNFDNSSGIVSSPVDYHFNFPGIFPCGIEFSPDSKKLYSSLLKITGSGPPANPSRVFQFDLNNGLNNPVLLDSMPGIRIAGMQLAPDGRIYVSRTVNHLIKRDSVDVIYNPNRPGIACNYNSLDNVTTRFSLLGRYGLFGFPNFVQSYFNKPAFTYDSICHGDVTSFNIVNKANIENVLWDFGDGSTSPVLSPTHQYAQPGTYTVKVTETFNGQSFVDSSSVTVHPLPPISFPADTIMLYTGGAVNLSAGEGFADYTWSTGAKTSSISATVGGRYWAKIEDFRCCFNSDSVFVNEFKYFVPSAFTPNGDGLNDNFKILSSYPNISVQIYIYDRWGRLVFESNDKEKGWDGKVNGKPAPADVYPYVIYVEFTGTDIVMKKLDFKGVVTLIR